MAKEDLAEFDNPDLEMYTCSDAGALVDANTGGPGPPPASGVVAPEEADDGGTGLSKVVDEQSGLPLGAGDAAGATLAPLVAEKVAQIPRDGIWSFYRLHNPAKIESGELGALLSKFRGREAEFYFRTRRKYLGTVNLEDEVKAFAVETLTFTSLQSFTAVYSVVKAAQTAKQQATGMKDLVSFQVVPLGLVRVAARVWWAEPHHCCGHCEEELWTLWSWRSPLRSCFPLA
jgi:hypothetical protein